MNIIINPIFAFYPFSKYSEHKQLSKTLINKAQLSHYIYNIINNHKRSFNSNSSIKNPLHLSMMKLSFVNYDFRNQYFKVICNKYSQLSANRIYQNERLVLTRWAKSFNQIHQYFKIIQFQPKVNRINYSAECLMINLLSKDIKNDIFAHDLEDYEGKRLALIMQKTFNSYFQNDSFKFNFKCPDNLQGSSILALIKNQENHLALYVKALLLESSQSTRYSKKYISEFAKFNTKLVPSSKIVDSVIFWQTELDRSLQKTPKTSQSKRNRSLSTTVLRSRQSDYSSSLSAMSRNNSLKSLSSALSFKSLSVESESSFASSKYSSLSSANSFQSKQSSLSSKELVSQREWLMKTLKREHRLSSTILFIGCSIVAIIAMVILAIS